MKTFSCFNFYSFFAAAAAAKVCYTIVHELFLTATDLCINSFLLSFFFDCRFHATVIHDVPFDKSSRVQHF